MAGSRTLKLSILADVDDLKKKLDTGANEVEGFGGKLEKFGKVAAAAFAAAAAAAAAYAGKLAIDGVKAAIEDEAAQQRLATALESVTGATESQIKAVEDQILKTSLATGVADDKLRPALQRLATATGSLDESQKLLNLALDISAGTGKDVESVSNALAKAYEGNTTSLERLGVGLDKGEVKTRGLQAATQKLTDLYGGSASTQAETFEGRIARLQVRFDETKESIGTALLPIIEKLLIFITDTLIPGFEKLKENAIDPVIKAIEDNKETFEGLYNFAKNTLLPFIAGTFTTTFKGIANVVTFIVEAVAAGLRALEPIINAAIAGFNAFISIRNALLPGADVAKIPSVDFGQKTTSTNLGNRPLGGGTLSTPQTTTTTTLGSISSNLPKVTTTTPNVTNLTTTMVPSGNAIPSNFNPAAVRAGEERGNVIINVDGALDPVATARQIQQILVNESSISGNFQGGLVSRFSPQVL